MKYTGPINQPVRTVEIETIMAQTSCENAINAITATRMGGVTKRSAFTSAFRSIGFT
jgi:hypothetical protein